MTSLRLRAFTIVELVVALGIAALLMGLVVASMRKDKERTAVYAAAAELANVMRHTRAMAMQAQAMHAVTFHIQNAPGSSGRVLNNRSGGHGYRIIGPSYRARTSDGVTLGAVPYPMDSYSTDVEERCFPKLLQAIKTCWIGDLHQLPAGKVRFLALSDTDEGPRKRDGYAMSPNQAWYPATYPRPWFGYFDQATQTLWPWGGYDANIPGSGFFYAGDDGAVEGCRHQADRTYDVDLNDDGAFANADLNGDGDTDDPLEQERSYVIWRKGEARPLVNSDWLDVTIAFLPDGSARMLRWMLPRRTYNNVQEPLPANNQQKWWVAGVRDMTRNDHGAIANNGSHLLGPYETGEGVSFDRHTGGWFITMAPDTADDRYQFVSAAEAIASMNPMVRVFVGRNGMVRIVPVKIREDALAGVTGWPPSPTDWQATGSNAIAWKDCRYGWLNSLSAPDTNANGIPDDWTSEPAMWVEDVDLTGTNSSAFIKAARGQPITDRLSSTMLTNRIWWTVP